MLQRAGVIAMNTYREAVRARILHGLLALAMATLGYALVVGAYTLQNQNRAVSNLGAASISIYAILVTIIVGATSLYRELELKTIFPILARPIHRAEYLVGKFLGTWLTLAVFIALNAGLLLFAVAALTTRSLVEAVGVPLAIIALAALIGYRVRRLITWLPIPVAALLLGVGIFFARDAVSERSVIVGQAFFTFLESGLVGAITLVFAAFSSPFLTAIFTLGVVVVGRSADALAKLPARMFGEWLKAIGKVLSQVFPNLMVYVPPRALLTGEAVGVAYYPYLAWATLQAVAWTVGLLTVAALIFRRRDFL